MVQVGGTFGRFSTAGGCSVRRTHGSLISSLGLVAKGIELRGSGSNVGANLCCGDSLLSSGRSLRSLGACLCDGAIDLCPCLFRARSRGGTCLASLCDEVEGFSFIAT